MTSLIDDQIEAVLEGMQQEKVFSEQYPKMIAHLGKLQTIKAEGRRDPIKWDTIALIAGNLLGILLIIAYEEKHVMTSRGFSHIIKPR